MHANHLIMAGILLIVLGVFWHLGLGSLPGDIRIRRPGLTVYIPLTSTILLSLVFTLVYWLYLRYS